MKDKTYKFFTGPSAMSYSSTLKDMTLGALQGCAVLPNLVFQAAIFLEFGGEELLEPLPGVEEEAFKPGLYMGSTVPLYMFADMIEKSVENSDYTLVAGAVLTNAMAYITVQGIKYWKRNT